MLLQLTYLHSHRTVQETPRTRQNRTNPLPRQHHRSRNVRVPPRHCARPADRQGRFRRRSPQPRAVKSRHTRIAAHRLHTWTHHHTAGRRRQPADCSATDGRGCPTMGRHAQVRGLRDGGQVLREPRECNGSYDNRVVVGRGGSHAEFCADGREYTTFCGQRHNRLTAA
jgi:hypothetical protein